MTEISILQTVAYFTVLLALVKPLGWYMACIYEGKNCGIGRFIAPIEHFLYRCCGIEPEREMNWKCYLSVMLIFNLIGFFVVYFVQRVQFFLPLNPQNFLAVSPALSFNTAISFVTNTNWQSYSGETTMSYFTQMVALTVQNFLSAATGMSLLVALIRGITRCESTNLGNFWVDIIRGTLYILLPLSLLLAIVLVSQGVIQNFMPNQKVSLVQENSFSQPKLDSLGQTMKDKHGNPIMESKKITEQVIPMGPVASQIAIKQLGTNGGGFFNSNSAHPFENPNPLTNFLEMLAILLIPAALCYTYGVMVGDKRQGWAIFAAMCIILIPLTFFTVKIEINGNPALAGLDVSQLTEHHLAARGNMEGKEIRFGAATSAIWASVTTAASNGSVNAMLDSFMPMGGFIPLFLMHLNEVVFGGVGSGLYSMLMLVIVTVFVAGLMVGRTPEYLGKKIEPFEIKMASLTVLVMPLIVLLLTAIASVSAAGTSSLANPDAHGFSEILYAFTSMGNNNGSAFAGLNANTFFYNTAGGLAMLISRYWIAIPVLAIAGSLVRKKKIPSSSGTLQTYTPLFIILLVSVIFIFGALSFIPALSLGPIIEHLALWEQYGH